MPSIIYKKDLADAIRRGMNENVVDLMLGRSMHQTGMLPIIYNLINEMAGSIELAYHKGYQAGCEDTKAEGGDQLAAKGTN